MAEARARFVLLSAAGVVLVMAVQGVLPAMPALQDEFRITNEQVGLFTLVYVVPGVVLTIPLSAVGSRISPRTVLGVALIFYGLSGAAQALVSSYAAMLALRLVQGTCFAAAMPLTLALTADMFTGRRQLRALAMRQTTITIGEFTLPLLGTLLAVLSWRGPLLVQALIVPLGVACLWVLDPRSAPRPPELKGISRLARVVFAQRGAVLVMLIAFARFLLKFSYIGYVPLLLVQHDDASLAQAGVVVAVASGMTSVGASRVPRLLRRLRPSRLVASAVAVSALALATMAATGDWRVALVTALGFGMADGFLVVLSDAYVTRLWSPGARPGAAAVSQTARNVGKLAAPIVMTAFLALGSIPLAFALLAVVTAGLIPLFLVLGAVDGQFAGGAPDPTPAPDLQLV
jgi:predicted MFS family arabinose efflux permease